MAREVFRSSFNLERPKHVLDKPIVVTKCPTGLKPSPRARAAPPHRAPRMAPLRHIQRNDSKRLRTYDLNGNLTGMGSTGTSIGGSYSSEARPWDIQKPRAGIAPRAAPRPLRPVRQIMPTAVHSLEEELHLAIVKLRELPRQAAIVKRRGRPPVRFRPAEVKPPLVSARGLGNSKIACERRPPMSPCARAADAEITARSEQWTTGKHAPSPPAGGGF